jgi:hypothetical protein
MADTIADVVVQLEADMSDVQQQLEGVGQAAESLGDVVQGCSAQMDLFAEAMDIPYADDAGQLNMFTDALEPISELADKNTGSLNEQADAGESLSEIFSHLSEKFAEWMEVEEKEVEIGEQVKEVLVSTLEEIVGVTFAIEGLKEALQEGFEELAKVERATEAFAALTGETENATEHMEELRKLGYDEGLKFPALMTAQQRLLAMQVPLEAIPEVLKSTADAAAATNMPFESMANMMGRIVGAGMISPRILQRMGISIKDMAEAMGVAQNRVREAFRGMEVEERVQVMEEALTRFKGLGEKVAQDLTGQWTNFRSHMSQTFEEVAEKLKPLAEEFLRFASETMVEIQKAVKDTDFTELLDDLRSVGRIMKEVIDLGVGFLKVFADVPGTVGVAAAALAGFATGNPWVAALVAIAQLAIELEKGANVQAGIEDSAKRSRSAVLQTAQNLLTLTAQYPEMYAQVRKLNDEIIRSGDADLPKYALALQKISEEYYKLNPAAIAVAETHKLVIKQSFGDAKAEIDGYIAHQEKLIAEERRVALEKEKDGTASAATTLETLHSLNERSYNLTMEGIRRRQGLEKLYPEQKGMTDVGAANARQAAEDKRRADNAKLDADYKAKGVALDKALTDNEIKEAQKAATGVEEAKVKAANAGVAMKTTSVMEAVAVERTANDEILHITQDSIAQQRALLKEHGDDLKAQALDKEGTAAVKRWADTNIELTNKVAREVIKAADDRIKAEKTSLDGADERALQHLETQRRINDLLVSSKQMSDSQREAADLDLDAQEDQIEANRLARDIGTLQLLSGAEHNYEAQIAGMVQRLETLRAKKHGKDELDDIKRQTEGFRELGFQAVSVYQDIANKADEAFAKIAEGYKKGTVSAYTFLESEKKNLEIQIQLAQAMGQSTAGLQATLAAVNVQILLLNYNLKDIGKLIQANLTQSVSGMWDKWAGGFAKAITDGKKFGDTMMNVLHQIENEILGKLIGTALKSLVKAFADVLAGGGAGGILAKVGGMLGGVAKGAGGGASAAAANAPLVASNTANTAATTADTTAVVANTAAVGVGMTTLTTTMVTLDVSLGILAASVDANTTALWATAFISGLQEGGQVMRTGVALVHAGETVASKNIMQGVGESLSAGGAGSGGGNQIVSFDGATFHGVPDSRYVSGIMNNAVRQLRQSSRTWAFDPTGK